jgi:hypothetical protein
MAHVGEGLGEGREHHDAVVGDGLLVEGDDDVALRRDASPRRAPRSAVDVALSDEHGGRATPPERGSTEWALESASGTTLC